MLVSAPQVLKEPQMTIYTRRGDAGETSLANGSRVSKDSPRVEAYGALDEAGCAVGFARLAASDARVVELLRFIQQRLMNCSAITARPQSEGLSDRVALRLDDVAALERAIDSLVDDAELWKGFVLDAGSEAAARLHLARSVTRRAERHLVGLSTHEPVDPLVLAFVNRASDALYAAARAENTSAGCPEEPWDPGTLPEL
jgi:cob(I)alamin adenosyltransferase